MTGTTSVDPAIADFAARVRRSLDDLPEDEIEDLTEGLEADLTRRPSMRISATRKNTPSNCAPQRGSQPDHPRPGCSGPSLVFTCGGQLQ